MVGIEINNNKQNIIYTLKKVFTNFYWKITKRTDVILYSMEIHVQDPSWWWQRNL